MKQIFTTSNYEIHIFLFPSSGGLRAYNLCSFLASKTAYDKIALLLQYVVDAIYVRYWARVHNVFLRFD